MTSMTSVLYPNLFLNQDYSDIQIHIRTTSDDRELVVPAHRLVLQTVSNKAFGTKLDSVNSQEHRNQVLELKVIGDTNVALVFLRYLYTKELEHVDLNVYICLLQTAQSYELGDMAKMCEANIANKVTPLTVCRTYLTLRNSASADLLTCCKDLMLEGAFLIFWKDLHLTLDETTMSFLLASDRLNVIDKGQVEDAVWRWGKTRKVFECQADNDFEKTLLNLRALLDKTLAKRNSWWFRSAMSVRQSIRRKTERRSSNDTLVIKTEPGFRNQIFKFAKVCVLHKVGNNPEENKVVSEKHCLMNISVKRDILLAGFTILVKYYPQDVPTKVRFSLNQKKILVGDYSKDIKQHLGASITVFDLIIRFRTPILVQKAQMNFITIDVEPRPDVVVPLKHYRLADPTGPFLNQDDLVAVKNLHYFD